MEASKEIETLQSRFGIAGVASIVAGNGGLAKIQISSAVAKADIYLHGAQVTAWQPAGSEEVIFLSKDSRWEAGRAIRGGIPICFPWFRAKSDDPKAPAHGVVRTKAWELLALSEQADGVVIMLGTQSDEASRKWWPYEFKVVHRITVGRKLKLELIATNTGTESFAIEEALHTYFSVGDVHQVRVAGLNGVEFLDNMDGNSMKTQSGDIVLQAATDNAYLATEASVELIDPSLQRRVKTEKKSSRTTIVWNPWEQASASLADLGNDEWTKMTCVEASNILSAAVPLAAGEEHTMTATISVEKL